MLEPDQNDTLYNDIVDLSYLQECLNNYEHINEELARVWIKHTDMVFYHMDSIKRFNELANELEELSNRMRSQLGYTISKVNKEMKRGK